MIIAFGHRKQQGKDTACDILYNHIRNTLRYGDRNPQPIPFRRAFAEPLYEICGLLVPEFLGKKHYDLFPIEKEIPIERIGKSPRQVLIDVGQHMKVTLGVDCFAVPIIHELKNSNATNVFLISDLRFPVEAEALQAIGGVCVEVTRPGIEVSNDPVDDALADWEGWDYGISNDGTLEDFKKKVIDLYEEIRMANPT